MHRPKLVGKILPCLHLFISRSTASGNDSLAAQYLFQKFMCKVCLFHRHSSGFAEAGMYFLWMHRSPALKPEYIGNILMEILFKDCSGWFLY
jgi:hypothetical protein